MELHEKHTHHSSSDLILGLVQDRHGQLHPVRGQGLRNANIYEQMHEPAGLVEKIWIEDVSGRVLFEAKRRDTLEDVRYLRDTAFPQARVCVYHGQHQAQRRCDDPDWGTGFPSVEVTIYPPKSKPTVNKLTPASKKSRKIKRSW